MKVIFEKWWDNGDKYFSIINFKKAWKENNVKPHFTYLNNGAKKCLGNTCLDINLIIGYVIINYTNWNLQKRKGNIR